MFLRVLLFVVLVIGEIFAASSDKSVAVLCYHRFSDEVKDSMTIKNSKFIEQLEWLKSNGYSVVSLDDAMKYLEGKKKLPKKSVVITVDDGHISVYSDLAPIVKKYKIPVTLFIYPSAISNASYAMSWEQLSQLEKTGFFRVESHTYYHPNFKQERKKLSDKDYQTLLNRQIAGSKKRLEDKMAHEIKYLAWPFGIYDDELLKYAKEAGYDVAFSIDAAKAVSKKEMINQPRYMVLNSHKLEDFAAMVKVK